jgi:N-acetylglucosamine kinase-like BadF-type ATPase
VNGLLGLDIGGSKTHALLVADGEVISDVTLGSANVASVGPAAAEAVLDQLLAALPDEAAVAVVCAGAAGADSRSGRDRLARLLLGRFPEARVEVVHDTRIILAAAEIEAGAVVIAGTGSSGWAVDLDGHEARAGGWGYLLGDEGSGYALVRSAVRQALRERDSGCATGRLTRGLLAATGAHDALDLLDLFYGRPDRRYWAGHAGVVIEAAAAAVPEAERMVSSAAAALADLGIQVTRQVGRPGPLVLAGGLLVHHPFLADLVTSRLTQAGLLDVRLLHRAPAQGAVALAQQERPR